MKIINIGTSFITSFLTDIELFINCINFVFLYSYDAQSFAIPVASLEFATLCLRNSLLLLSGSTIDCSPSNPVTPQQIVNLRASVLVASAYVSLCLGDPIVAMNNCKNLLNISNCSGIHKYVSSFLKYCRILDKINNLLLQIIRSSVYC